MDRPQEQGSLAVTVILILLLISAITFGLWAFSGRQSYKNDVDKKIAVATAAAVKQTQHEDAIEYDTINKQPLKDFQGPATYGSLHVKYPKTWSAYISLSGNPVNGYFEPDFVPDLNNSNSVFALRVVITSNSYSQEVQQFNDSSKSGLSTVSAFSLKNVPSVVGVRVDGKIINDKQGSMILLPLRDKTIEIWTESNQYLADFNDNILPNITFSP